MKFMIAIDLEGLACVVGSPGTGLSESRNYLFACRQGVREVNTAVKALFDMGATEVLVWDNHGDGVNLDYDDLDKRCDIILGSGEPHRWPGLDNTFAGVLLVGYHSMDNTVEGVLAHSFNSKLYQWIKINGIEVGEIEIDAAVAGEMHQVPVIFVSSDDKGVIEAKKFLPWVETVTTKVGLSRNSAISRHPSGVLDDIYDGVRRAVAKIENMKAYTFDTPIEIEKRYKRIDDAEDILKRNLKQFKRIDAYTVRQTVDKIIDIY
jgi:D-aminopeptidase